MSNMHHENKSAKVFIMDWPVVLPLVPLGIWPTTDRILMYLGFIIIMAILGIFKIRTSTLFIKLIARIKGKRMHSRNKNNRHI